MVSLKHFLNLSQKELAFRSVVSLLLAKIGSGVVRSDAAGYDTFLAEMSRIQERASTESTPEALFAVAGSAGQAMDNYNCQVTALMGKQASALRSIVSMITETAIQIGGENARSSERLQEIGQKFERADEIDDLGTLKSHLRDCLHTLRDEAERRKTESDEAIRSLQQEIVRRAEQSSTVLEDLDIVTSLPLLAAGLRAMQGPVKSDKRRYVAVMVVDRIKLLNLRFGIDAGNSVLRVFKESLEQKLIHGDQLFRWNGPTIVALLDRTESVEQVRVQIRRLLGTRIEETLEVEQRSVLISISASWSVFPLMSPIADVTKQIQAFIASQGGGDCA
jgi:GGDEF domain-containing protein